MQLDTVKMNKVIQHCLIFIRRQTLPRACNCWINNISTLGFQRRCFYALTVTVTSDRCENNNLIRVKKQYCKGDQTETVYAYKKNLRRKVLENVFQNNKETFKETDEGLQDKDKIVSRNPKLKENIYTIPRTKVLENVLEHNKEVLRETEQRLRQKSNVIIQDIKATKNKMKERMEEVIERENIYTIPNFLCVSRILLTPYLGLLIIQSNFNFALVVLGFAAVTDFLDGWIARTWTSQSSKVGSFLDPMADKILIATLFLTLTYNNLIPIPLTALIIARDVILLVAGFVIRYKSLPPPRTLSRYFDASHATAQLAPTFISKANTTVQLLLVGSTLAAPVFNYVDHPTLQCLWYFITRSRFNFCTLFWVSIRTMYITGATTVAAGLSYVISKDTYKFLKKTKS